MNGVIKEFRGIYRWLSNFEPVVVHWGEIAYPSVENAYQASKTWPEYRRPFETCTAVEAKKLGKRVPMRPEFHQEKLEIMRDLTRQKYQHPGLRRKLKETEDWLLIEGNWWGDRFWGQCQGEGENHLGRIIMSVRREIQQGDHHELRSKTATGQGS